MNVCSTVLTAPSGPVTTATIPSWQANASAVHGHPPRAAARATSCMDAEPCFHPKHFLKSSCRMPGTHASPRIDWMPSPLRATLKPRLFSNQRPRALIRVKGVFRNKPFACWSSSKGCVRSCVLNGRDSCLGFFPPALWTVRGLERKHQGFQP